MAFISVFYLIFLVLVTAGYYLLPTGRRAIWLLGASYFFYLTWQPAFLVVLAGVTLLAFWLANRLAAVDDRTKKKRWLTGGVIALLLPLIFFKYYNFLNENLAALLGLWRLADPLPAQTYLVPLGISFFTFQAISYVADVYRGYLAPADKIERFAVYMAFFPTLLAGPIERAKSILGQLGEPRAFAAADLRAGLQLILWGVFKKVVLADRMADFLEKVYGDPQNHPGIFIYLALVFTGLQVFCDFSAYSDIAVGSARLLGIKLSKNFDDRVYAAPSREIFWRGWHRSLTSWMRDYVFFPLSRRTKSKAFLYLNLLIVYLLVGVWHGATWGFIVWGLLNGLWLVAENATKHWRHDLFTRLGIDLDGRFFYFLGWLTVFHVGSFFGIFFRTATPREAFAFLANIGNPNAGLAAHAELKSCLLIVAFLVLMDQINRRIPPGRNFDAFIDARSAWVRWLIYIMLAELVLRYIFVFNNAGFVYFNF